MSIIKKILKKNPSKKIYSSEWKIIIKRNKFFYKDKKNFIPILTKYIFSNALISNLGMAIKVALDLGVKKEKIIRTIPKIKFEGRVHYISKGKIINKLYKNEKILIDGCHSKISAKNLNDYLKTVDGPIYGIWGMQKNKMPEQFIKTFKNTFKKIITITIPEEPNAMQANDLLKIGKKNNFAISKCLNFDEAIKQISSRERKTIVIFGSLYFVGYFLRIN